MKAIRLLAFTCAASMMFFALGCGGSNNSTASSPTPAQSPGSSPGNPPGAPPSPGTTPSNATFLYVANAGTETSPGGFISGYSIDSSTGALKPINGSPFAADVSPAVIAGDPGGHFVFVGENNQPVGVRGANCNGFHSTLLSERVDGSSGILTQADRKVLDGSCVSSVAVDPSGTKLYVGMQQFGGSAGAGEIQVFSIAASGNLTEVAGSPLHVNGITSGIAFHLNGKFVYGASDSGVQVFNRDANSGLLTLRGVFNGPKVDVALNPSGTFLVATDAQTNQVAEFNVDQNTGDIAATEQFAAASNPLGITTDPLGSYFASTEITDQSTGAGGVSTFQISTAGGTQLVKTPGSPFASGRRPVDVVFEPTGKFVYSANFSDGNITGFALNRNSGALTQVSGSPFVSQPFPLSLTVVKPH